MNIARIQDTNSYKKLSKKERRKVNLQSRKDWNGTPPATRIIPSAKLYKRNKKDPLY